MIKCLAAEEKSHPATKPVWPIQIISYFMTSVYTAHLFTSIFKVMISEGAAYLSVSKLHTHTHTSPLFGLGVRHNLTPIWLAPNN